LDGAVAILQSYKLLLDESVARSRFPKLVLSGCPQHWPDCHARIGDFLRFASPPPAMPPP
jgi:hypothetical protein